MGSNPIPSAIIDVWSSVLALSPNAVAKLSLTALALPLSFVAAALIHHGLGLSAGFASYEELVAVIDSRPGLGFLTPALFLGGALAAFAMNAMSVLRIELTHSTGRVGGTVSLGLLPANLAAGAAGLLVLLVLVSYAVTENWQCWVGDKVSC